jgi:hypothetical protein
VIERAVILCETTVLTVDETWFRRETPSTAVETCDLQGGSQNRGGFGQSHSCIQTIAAGQADLRGR